MIMHMARTVKLTLVFSLGAVGGWYAHDYWLNSQGLPSTAESIAQIGHHSPLPPRSAPHTSQDGISTRLGVLNNLLISQKFDQAVEFYDALSATANDAVLAEARARILKHADALIDQGHTDAAVELLTQFLNQDFRNVEARELLSKAHRGNRDYLAAINVLYDAKGHAYQTETLERLNTRIRKLVTEHAAALSSRQDYARLVQLYRHLVQLEPDHSSYFLELAKAQLALDDYHSARQSLSLIAYDPDVGQQATELLDSLNKQASYAETSTVAIPMTRIGNQFVVEALLNRSARVRLLLDTGASLTIIEPSALNAAGIRYLDTGRRGQFNTAGGKVQAPILVLNELSLGDQAVTQLEVAGIELSEAHHIDGLLGMNYLRHFRFFIDQNAGVLRLSSSH